jgi:uncharacterized membrane protein YkvA (DUF1232 family)
MSKAQLPAPDSHEQPGSPLGWIADIVRQGRLAWRLLWDSRVPFWTKLIPIVTVAWVMPIIPPDIIPDAFVGLGQLDDLAIFLIGMKLFIELAPTEIVRQHLAELGARIQEWRVDDGKEEAPPQIIEGEFEAAESDDASVDIEEAEIVEVVEAEEVEAEEVEAMEAEEVEEV